MMQKIARKEVKMPLTDEEKKLLAGIVSVPNSVKKGDLEPDESGVIVWKENQDGRWSMVNHETQPSVPVDTSVYRAGFDPFKHPYEATKPFDIDAIRELSSGTKKRKQSMEDLHKFAEYVVNNRGNSIYIPGNVASSKNSKEIGFYYKKVNGKNVKMNILVNSKATKAYIKNTSKYWPMYRPHFLNMAANKGKQLLVEFTFIREDIGRFDYGNAQQVLADLMVDNGWIQDDDTEHFVPVFNRIVYYSAKLAGVIIKVL